MKEHENEDERDRTKIRKRMRKITIVGVGEHKWKMDEVFVCRWVASADGQTENRI